MQRMGLLLMFFWANVVLPAFDLVMDILTANKILQFYFNDSEGKKALDEDELKQVTF